MSRRLAGPYAREVDPRQLDQRCIGVGDQRRLALAEDVGGHSVAGSTLPLPRRSLSGRRIIALWRCAIARPTPIVDAASTEAGRLVRRDPVDQVYPQLLGSAPLPCRVRLHRCLHLGDLDPLELEGAAPLLGQRAASDRVEHAGAASRAQVCTVPRRLLPRTMS